MTRPGSLCPAVKASELLGDKWTLLLLRELFFGASRYSEFQRALPRISPTVLSQRLKRMEAQGLLVRERGNGSGKDRYGLSESARELAPIVDALARWGLRWAREQLCDDDLDAGTFLWDFHRALDSQAFPEGRTTLGIELEDGDTSNWWIVIDGKTVDLCNQDPGFEVDLYLLGSLSTFARIFLGDRSVRDALGQGELRALGRVDLERSISRWFPRSGYAHVRSARPNAVPAHG